MSLGLACLQVGVQIEAGALHCARRQAELGFDAEKVALSRGLHLGERASERHHSAPQIQQLGMLLAKVVIERLFFSSNYNYNCDKKLKKFA